MPPLVDELSTDIVLLAVSETIAPDALFVLLDDLRDQHPALVLQSLALFDTRTCDCFPHLRVSLEEYADAAVYLPLGLDDVLEVLA